mmetsp:Transcript_51680/g.52082  ORF Transcript_51680/g.52082 Transcript_51680/m.52082 type:complete len:88 (-) Transcript_51680:1143-1406(-)
MSCLEKFVCIVGSPRRTKAKRKSLSWEGIAHHWERHNNPYNRKVFVHTARQLSQQKHGMISGIQQGVLGLFIQNPGLGNSPVCLLCK